MIDKAGEAPLPYRSYWSNRRGKRRNASVRRVFNEEVHKALYYPQQESIRKGLLEWRCKYPRGKASETRSNCVDSDTQSRKKRCKCKYLKGKAPSVLIFDRFVRTDSPIGCYTQSVQQDHRCTQRANCPSYNRILRQSTADSFIEPHYKTVPLSVLLVVGTVSY